MKGHYSTVSEQLNVRIMKSVKRKKQAISKGPATFSGRELSGILLKPISIPFFPDKTGNAEVDVEIEKVRNRLLERANTQWTRRMEALATLYGVELQPTIESFYLVLKLFAFDVIPGFQLDAITKTGRPSGTYKIGGEKLWKAVNTRLEKGETIIQACEHLSRHGAKTWRLHNPASLKSAYLSFKNKVKEAYQSVQDDAEWATMIRIIGYPELLNQAEKRLNSQRGKRASR